jgi:hypothetical protein
VVDTVGCSFVAEHEGKVEAGVEDAFGEDSSLVRASLGAVVVVVAVEEQNATEDDGSAFRVKDVEVEEGECRTCWFAEIPFFRLFFCNREGR